jgi:sodium transport system ATP-binding protein
MLEARGLTKIFHDKKRGPIRAVDDVSLLARPGQIYGLLGANGAGKTTLLRLFATMLKPSAGSATVAGHDLVAAPDQVRAEVGFLAASTALYDRLTARELIGYFGRLHGLDDEMIARRTATIATELAMDDFLDRRIEKFSTGMKQKTSIARMLIHDPAVMIFDEPTLGLDVLAARGIVRFIHDCRARGKTVVYSTHVMSEVEKLCDVVGVMHGGRLLEAGAPAELRGRHGATDMEEAFVRIVTAGETA